MARTLEKQMKSAKRALEVLTFFNATRREATVSDISRAYAYPQSSTSELLSCLVELGFLRRDRRSRAFRPTAKVAVLGSWVHPRLFRHGELLSVMDSLVAETGCTVVLSGEVGLRYEYFHTAPGSSALRPADQASILTQGAMGRLLLSSHDGSQIRKFVHRLNSEAPEAQRVRLEDLLADIERIRRQGYAVGEGVEDGGPGIIAVRLPQGATEEVLGLGLVVGEGDPRGFSYHLRALRHAIAAGLGPILAHEQIRALPPVRRAL